MTDVLSTIRLFAIAVLISASLAVGTAVLGSTVLAHSGPAAVVVLPVS